MLLRRSSAFITEITDNTTGTTALHNVCYASITVHALLVLVKSTNNKTVLLATQCLVYRIYMYM